MQLTISYFGKIPSRGDFIKAGDSHVHMQVIDNWLTEVMSGIAEDPRWQLNYDSAPTVDFVFIGMKKKQSLAGHVHPSVDSAQRRFPFLCFSEIELTSPADFASASPVVLSRYWNRLNVQTKAIVSAPDANALLTTLTNTPIEVETSYDHYKASLKDFLEIQSLGSLAEMLRNAGFVGNVRQTIIALGLLLSPLAAQSDLDLDKGLVLPLPSDPMYKGLVGAFWMHLMTPFLAKLDIEIVIFMTSINQQSSMLIGFNGETVQTLENIFSPQAEATHLITLEDADWVEEQVAEDYSLDKLSSYLSQPDFSLHSVLSLFNNTFLGA